MQAKNTSTAYSSRLSGADTSLTQCTIDGVKPDNLTNFGIFPLVSLPLPDFCPLFIQIDLTLNAVIQLLQNQSRDGDKCGGKGETAKVWWYNNSALASSLGKELAWTYVTDKRNAFSLIKGDKKLNAVSCTTLKLSAHARWTTLSAAIFCPAWVSRLRQSSLDETGLRFTSPDAEKGPLNVSVSVGKQAVITLKTYTGASYRVRHCPTIRNPRYSLCCLSPRDSVCKLRTMQLQYLAAWKALVSNFTYSYLLDCDIKLFQCNLLYCWLLYYDDWRDQLASQSSESSSTRAQGWDLARIY